MIREQNGKWLNSKAFSQEAIKFAESGTYCSAPTGTPEWFNYWQEQLERCIYGYEVEGEKITGHHYFYLNFTQIQIVEEIEGTAASRKYDAAPDFWDGDFDYFWCVEIAKNGLYSKNSQVPVTEEERTEFYRLQKIIDKLEYELEDQAHMNEEYVNAKRDRDEISSHILYDRLKLRVRPHPDYLNGGNHMIVGKARRKGYSYKNGAMCANVYNTQRNAQVVIGAFEKKFLYPKGTMGMTTDYLNYINEHTGWAKSRDYVDKQEHKRASYKQVINGVAIEKGYKSEVFALSFKDNPHAARGKDAKILLLEEAGAFPNLEDSYSAIRPALTAGRYITGQMIIFGTGGDMKSGTIDYANMFYNPETYGLLPFINIWDEDADNTTCGFFHPVVWNLEGFYDDQGNSDVDGALEFEMKRRRKILSTSSSSSALQDHVQEWSLCPSEAFLTVSTNNFPVMELRRQLNKVTSQGLNLKKGQPVHLFEREGKVVAKPDLKRELSPILHYRPKESDLSGCPIIYEYPVENPPKGLYKIGFDPYRQDLSKGVSLAAIYVYKASHKFSYSGHTIVAEYIGRPQETDDVNRIAMMLAELYNAEIMHENEVTNVKNFFRQKKKLNLLSAQPDNVISKSIKHSTVARIYGIHMTPQLKDDGAKYIKDWLLQVRDYDENGNKVLNLEKIYSIGLLEELIAFNTENNFDRVMAFMMVMFQLQEDELEKEYGEGNEKIDEIIEMMDNLYNN